MANGLLMGKRCQCGNYLTIKLLEHGMKVMERQVAGAWDEGDGTCVWEKIEKDG